MSIGKKIEMFRKRKSMSQEQLAEELRVKTQTVMYWEMDVEEPDSFDLLDLSRVLGVPVDALTGNKPAYASTTNTIVQNPIESLLLPNEVLLWSGKPVEQTSFQPQDIFMSFFGFFFFAFSLFWTITAIQYGIFGIFGLPFVAIGGYLLFGRFQHMKIIKRHTFYALTNERILFVSGQGATRVRELRLASIQNMDIRRRANNEGSIYFNQINAYGSVYRNRNVGSPNNHPYYGHHQFVFQDISNVQAVYQLIQETIPKK